jgi:hypothetical protein
MFPCVRVARPLSALNRDEMGDDFSLFTKDEVSHPVSSTWWCSLFVLSVFGSFVYVTLY